MIKPVSFMIPSFAKQFRIQQLYRYSANTDVTHQQAYKGNFVDKYPMLAPRRHTLCQATWFRLSRMNSLGKLPKWTLYINLGTIEEKCGLNFDSGSNEANLGYRTIQSLD